MKNLQTLDREGFLDVLCYLPSGIWAASIEDKCIHLRRLNSARIYSPLTAVYFELTSEELHRGSFSHPEITERFGLPWWDILDITYAEICCVANGRHYNSKLRIVLLDAVAPLIHAGEIIAYLADLDRERLKSS